MCSGKRKSKKQENGYVKKYRQTVSPEEEKEGRSGNDLQKRKILKSRMKE